MATPAEIAAFRLLIAEADATTYTDAVLSARLDALGADRVAYDIWTEKAAAYSTLVDVAESGSSRKLSDLHKNALAMRATFGASLPGGEAELQVGVRLGKIVRK